ncbi:hypothetical protein ABEW00_08070 [Rossellomorea vietnamensis]|uniref:hypothetical protein n=1 Tax=Rossellomorea vietnamensis TaxID=218284 RepID=UPI003D2B63FF
MLAKQIEDTIKDHQEVVTKKYNELAACFKTEFEEGSYELSYEFNNNLALVTTYEDETEYYTFKVTPYYEDINIMSYKRSKKSNSTTGSGNVFKKPMDAVLEIKKSIKKIKEANEFLAYAKQKLEEKKRNFVKPLSDSEVDFLITTHKLISEIEFDKLKFDESKIVDFM